MATDLSSTRHVWQTGTSIALELDVVLSTAGRERMVPVMPSGVTEMLSRLPGDWLASWESFYGGPRSLVNLLEPAAYLAGVLLEEDYERAALAIRELSIAQALERLAEAAAPFGLVPVADLDPLERLADLGMRLAVANYTTVGLKVTSDDAQARSVRGDYLRAAGVLRGGPQAGRFWLWLDRFYYEYYRPWRESRLEEMAGRRQQMDLALADEAASPLELIPERSPLRVYPELENAVQSGQVSVTLWVEPFGLSDFWSFYPGELVTAFASPGEMYEGFLARADDLALKAQALADPTRLIILRIIRNFGMVNTEMAKYLGLARPTVSVHAKILREAGLIRSYPDGRLVRHEIIPSEVRKLFRDLEDFLDLPDEE